MTLNLIQYAAGFVAVGCKLNYVSHETQLHIVDYPKGKELKETINSAIKDIELFEDTSNFQDGQSSVMLAEFLDNEPNPLPENFRLNVLNSLGIMKGDRFVAQVLARDKVNRSWHISDEQGKCSRFGNLCTHRGTIDDPHKRGRKATRKPNEYHRWSSRGISREQLITPSLYKLYELIPRDKLVSQSDGFVLPSADMLAKMEPEKLAELMVRIQEVMK